VRTLTWVSPLGITKRITIGGQRRRPVSSVRTASLDTFEHFLDLQRTRVAHRLQQMDGRIAEGRTDGMSRTQALKETTIERRG